MRQITLQEMISVPFVQETHLRLFFLFLVWSNLFVCSIWIELELLISIDFRRFIFGEPFDFVSLRSISFSIFVCNARIRLKYKIQAKLGLVKINPYWQILKNSSRKFSEISVLRGVTQTDFWKTHPIFSPNFNFWGTS